MSASYSYRPPSEILLESGTLIKQGAEAKVYSVQSFIPLPTIYWPPSSSSSKIQNESQSSTRENDNDDEEGGILKYRFTKTYRHPTLDAALTKTRLSFEARALARAARAGVVVPKVLCVDESRGLLGLEKIDGWSVREILGGGAEGELEYFEEEEEIEGSNEVEVSVKDTRESTESGNGIGRGERSEGMEALNKLGITIDHLMRSIGSTLSKLHQTSIIHGDLTTSNMMVRLTPNHHHHQTEPFEIVMIDFGLSSTAQYPENYAVDLYVLERAFASTHPQSENLYAGVLEAYALGLGEKKWRPIETKLKDDIELNPSSSTRKEKGYDRLDDTVIDALSSPKDFFGL